MKEEMIRKITEILKKAYKYVALDIKKRTIIFSDIEHWASYHENNTDTYRTSSFFLGLSLVEIIPQNDLPNKFSDILDKINDEIERSE